MLSKESFYANESGAYVISKMTEKTVTFAPVKSVFVKYGRGSAFLYDVEKKATMEPDESREPIRFMLKNNFSTRGLAQFYENKKGRMEEMSELDGDIFILERNLG